MEQFRLWDKKSNVRVRDVDQVTNNDIVRDLTPDEFRQLRPLETDGECVLQYISANIVGGFDSLDMLSDTFKIDETGKTPQEIFDAVIAKMNEPVSTEPTSEERIASAMEYQNIMNY